MRASSILKRRPKLIGLPQATVSARLRFFLQSNRRASSLIRVGGITKAVTKEIEGENHDDHGHHGEHQPRVERNHVDVLRLVQQHAQLVMGGLKPRPRKLNAVSPRIIAGIESVAVAIKWLMNPGTRWRKIIRFGLAPMSRAAIV